MTDLRAAAQQALEALDTLYRTLTPETPLAKSLKQRADTLRAALAEPEPPPEAQTDAEKIAYCAGWWNALAKAREAALAEPVQEPVAWLWWGDNGDGTESKHVHMGREFSTYWKSIRPPTPLYAAPPQRKPLTEEEVNDLMDQIPREDVDAWSFRQGVCAAEAAHGIGGKT